MLAVVVCKKHLFLAFLLNSLLQCIFAQNCPQDLANVVVYAGNSTSFSRANNSRPVQWQVAPSSVTVASLRDITGYDDDVVMMEFSTTYAVSATRLKILKATTAPEGTMPYATAGLYIVNYQEPDCTTAAGLVVIESGPICTCDASTANSVRLQCSVDFANYNRQQIKPIMTWKSNSGAALFTDEPQPTPLDPNNEGLQMSVSQYSPPAAAAAAGGAASSYECRLTFSRPLPDQPEFIAANAPDFTASCFIANCAKTTNSTTDLVTFPAPQSKSPPPMTMTIPLITQMAASAFSCSAQTLLNTAVYAGSVASFPRTDSNAPLAVKWAVAPASSTMNSLMDITNYDDRVAYPFETTYAVNSSQLTILKASVAPAPDESTQYSTAGLYAIDYQDSNCIKAAGLVVIREGPNCRCDASNRNSVKLVCGVVFANYINQRINPTMTWMHNSSGTVAEVVPQPVSLDINNPGLQSSESQLPVAGTDASTYECRLTFTAPTASNQPEFVAANAPNFAASCFIANCAVRTTVKPLIPASTKTEAPPSTVAPKTNSSSTSLKSTAISHHTSTSSSEITVSSIAQRVITATTPLVSTTLSNSTTTSHVSTTLSNSKIASHVSTTLSNSTSTPLVSTALSNSQIAYHVSTTLSNSTTTPHVSTTLSNSTSTPLVSTTLSNSTTTSPVSITLSNSTTTPHVSTTLSNTTSTPLVSTTLTNSTSSDAVLSTSNSSVTISIFSLNESTQSSAEVSQNSSTIRPAAIPVISGIESETQARTVLLCLVFGSLLSTAVVIVCWYFFCCPYPPRKTGTKRRIKVRRNIFKTQPKEQATTPTTQPREHATLNTQPKEQATLNRPKEQTTVNTQPNEQATLNTQPREQATLNTQENEETSDSLRFEAASDVQF